MDPRGTKRDTSSAPEAPRSLQSRLRGHQVGQKAPRGRPKGRPERSKGTHGAPRGRNLRCKASQKPPKRETKKQLFCQVVKSQILKDVPYKITEFRIPGPQKSNPKTSQEPEWLKRAANTGHRSHPGRPGSQPRSPREAGKKNDALSDPQGSGPGNLVI